jgi:hypothetical protein
MRGCGRNSGIENAKSIYSLVQNIFHIATKIILRCLLRVLLLIQVNNLLS